MELTGDQLASNISQVSNISLTMQRWKNDRNRLHFMTGASLRLGLSKKVCIKVVHHFGSIEILHHFLQLFCLHYSCTVRLERMLGYLPPFWFWVIHSVLCMFWLVLSYDLLKDRHIDDDSPQFKFHSCMISLNLSEWLLICKATNECASFCMDNRLHNMAIFTS